MKGKIYETLKQIGKQIWGFTSRHAYKLVIPTVALGIFGYSKLNATADPYENYPVFNAQSAKEPKVPEQRKKEQQLKGKFPLPLSIGSELTYRTDYSSKTNLLQELAPSTKPGEEFYKIKVPIRVQDLLINLNTELSRTYVEFNHRVFSDSGYINIKEAKRITQFGNILSLIHI